MFTYRPEECAVFYRTRDAHGGLSNMAAGYPIEVNKRVFRTSEALYQACRFPDHPDLQEAIRLEKSPMSAKWLARKHLEKTRAGWDVARVPVMLWCLVMKRLQNQERVDALYAATNLLPIVEMSRKDDFWGAMPQADGSLVGLNTLGRLHDFVREYHDHEICGGGDPDHVPGGLVFFGERYG